MSLNLTIYQKYFSSLEHPCALALKKLLQISNYACCQIEVLQTLLKEDSCQNEFNVQHYEALLTSLPDSSQVLFSSALRQFRHRQLLRLMLRQLSGLSTTIETMTAWSDCADAILLRTLAFCEQKLSSQYGQPHDEQGNLTQLYTIAMGKLGGRELNYSSDVDLMFAFSASGYTQGKNSITNQEYYTKVIQLFIQLLQTSSKEGFVFRIDLRLRPNGDSGALVCSLAALETYYQEQGRDWERYAMIKARLIGKQPTHLTHWFHRLMTCFVYRRYVDFSVIESLRSMKAMIVREVQLNPRLDDIKRGQGGIREIEFIIQNIQLIRGGRLPTLRHSNAMIALDALKQEGLLSHTGALRHAYLFLRELENVLQAQNDQQTHLLPKDAAKIAQVVLAMGYSDSHDLLKKISQCQRIVSAVFRLALGVDAYNNHAKILSYQLTSLWQGHIEPTMAINLLENLGFKNAERCYQMIYFFRHAPRCRRLTYAARIRLDRFMILLLAELTQVKETENVLLHVMHLLESIVGRSAYLALLAENPHVLKELLYWFSHSPFITSLLVRQPFLLEVLLEQEVQWKPKSRHQLKQLLKKQLSHQISDDVEETLRQFKLMNWLSAARAELHGEYDALKIGQFLADVAQVILEVVIEISYSQLKARYPEIEQIKNKFAIIAYGKLGSQEMNYNSDLDLVFIHIVLPEEEALITRLVQKVLHILTARSQSGILYSVDTRLRPSGSAGLLISHMNAFIEYQCHSAWTWEHQALLRARVLSGSKLIRLAFNQLKRKVLTLERNKEIIRQDVLAMRAKINEAWGKNSDEVQQIMGGLLDLEFLVQFLVLIHPNPTYALYTNTLTLLEKLFDNNVLSEEQWLTLKQAYKDYHHILHKNLLKPDYSMNTIDNIQEVMQISNVFLN